MDRVDPIWGLLREEGRYNLVWLARRVGYSHSHVKAIAAGLEKASPRFRAACALLLGRPEADLFNLAGGDDHGASGGPKRGGFRAGTAGRGVYALPSERASDAAGGAVA